MKSKRKLAKELLKLVKNNGLYDPFDYDYQRDENVAVCNDKEVINALCNNLTKTELKKLQHKDTAIYIFGWYEASLCIANYTLDVRVQLIYLGRLMRADTHCFRGKNKVKLFD